MSVALALTAIAAALAAGVGVTGLAWPRDRPLPALAWFGLAGLLGPCAIGLGLLLCGIAGVPTTVALPVLTAVCVVAGAAGIRNQRAARHPQGDPRGRPRIARASSRVVVVAVLLAGGWAGWLSARTHLGWDGTLVWYQKARIIAASGGVLPAATVADLTRKWTAPDYPLHVPLAMAWLRLWLPGEDERVIKVLPALWAAAVFALVGAAVMERTGARRDAPWRATCAVLVLATAPRLLVGEGSLTSGYADGPLAGLLAATVWVAWMSGWGADRRFVPVLAATALALAWTKQEGALAVVVVALACVAQGRAWRRAAFAVPALGLAIGWQAWTMWQGAPAAMVYAWPGLGAAAWRPALTARAYVREMLDASTWGIFWPGLCVLAAAGWHPSRRVPLCIVAAVLLAGAAAFTLSTWIDLEAHLLVTVPRQLIQAAPTVAIVAFASGEGADDRPIR